MRGVKYSLEFVKPGEETEVFNNLGMSDIRDVLQRTIKEKYNLEMNVSKNMVYNLVHRPLKANKFVRQMCTIHFMPKPQVA
tara:strand:- start:569 stop:811 length:243 start_codon:yes stop_codon:yes gene_type:complete